jgi:hypothetical protein
MADAPYFLRRLVLTAFRAYLQPKEFIFAVKRSLAVFGPNGYGKSSLVDGLEFVFSPDGSLERLGQRAVNNQAGPIALAHNEAESVGLEPSVTVAFVQGKTVIPDARREAAAKSKRPMPPIAKAVKAGCVVDPIIRGYSLRAFVESETAETRYAAVASWLQLGLLVEVQKNLRQLRAQVKEASEDQGELQRIDRQVGRLTGSKVAAWDEAKAVAYVNDAGIAPLDATLKLATLATDDTGYLELTRRVKAEEGKLGLDGLRLLHRTAGAIWATAKEGAGEKPAGTLPAFEGAAMSLLEAVNREAAERAKAKDAAFEKLWQAAAPFFRVGAEMPETCPVCATPLDKTAAGGGEAIGDHISQHLAGLADYAAASQGLRTAETAAADARRRLLRSLDGLADLLHDGQAELEAQITKFRGAVDRWTAGAPPASAELLDAITGLVGGLDAKIQAIEKKQGEHTYAKAQAKADALRELKTEYETAKHTLVELTKLSAALNDQAATVSSAIRAKVQSLLDRLRKPINEIYALIQGQGAAAVRLELPPEDDTNQQRLNLLIDFAGNREAVQPSGYLSDSQIHSLALSLRLAAILEFNTAAPIVVLDDIVTSYDADHRRTFAKMLAAKFAACQLIIVTHDERFFQYLKELLAPADWNFTRITGVVPAFGPRFADDMVTDDMIEARWTAGQSAANEMRQAEEEWLLARCRDFGVNVRIRPLERPYSYERSELASALAGYLRGAGLTPQPLQGIQNRFLSTLEKGEVENFGSHFQDAQHGGGSIGDEKTRWDEFKAFRAQFTCRKCGRDRFKRPATLKKPVCARDGCEAQFEFPGPVAHSPAAAATAE